jgi:hypothetical protein
MAEIVNLNRARKRLARDSAEQQASENRARFGRSKAERQREADEAQRKAALLDSHRIDPDKPS